MKPALTLRTRLLRAKRRQDSFRVKSPVPCASGRLRRFVYRVDGFVSVRAGLAGGVILTKPLTFQGNELVLNYIAWPLRQAGEVRVEIQDTRMASR